MKIWIKFLLGCAIGTILGLLFPSDAAFPVFEFLAKLTVQIARYAIFPLVFFSLAIGTYELKRENSVLRTYGRAILYMLLSSTMLSLLGTASVLVLSPDRIPIVIEEEIRYAIPTVQEVFLRIFPKNYFKVFTDSGDFLLPLAFLSLFLGLNFTFDRLVTRPAVQFFDSMSRIFYHINSFVMEILGIGVIAISAAFFITLRATPELALFKQLLIILGIDSVIVLLGIYPAVLYFLGGKSNPYKWLYAILAPAIAGFITGDGYFALGSMIKNGKENLGIPRKIGSATFPLLTIFGKAGTALVTSVSFIIILKSYTSLEITLAETSWVVLFSFLVSMALGSVPGLGVIVSLSVLSSRFGGGYEEGFLILKPVAPLLLSFGVLLDIATASFVSLLVAKHEKSQKEIEVGEFI